MSVSQLMRGLAIAFRVATILLACAFVVLLIRPQWLSPLAPRVEVLTRDGGPATRAAGVASYAAPVQAAAPSVVNITTARNLRGRGNALLEDPVLRFFFGDELRRAPRQPQASSLGSGVIVSAQGYVLTNHHVIAGADEIRLALADGRTLGASVVGSDPETDIAVLKVAQDGLPPITLGDSESLAVGDVVLAIGNPFGVGQTVTLGIVSATRRNDLGISTFENFIQTDAAINPGNSGGALINAAGELVGINTAIFSRSGGSQGIGFAIPVTLARQVMEQIIEHGRPIRGWLGVGIQDLDDALRESFGLGDRRGVVVTAVIDQGPAEKAGLRPGDVLTHVGGQAVSSTRELLEQVTRHRPGTAVALRGLRDGKSLEWKVTVGERPIEEPE